MKSSTKIVRTLLILVSIFSGLSTFGQEAAATATPVAADQTMYEKFGMTSTQLCSLMIILTVILVAFVFSLSASAKNILEFKKENMKNGLKMILALVGLFATSGSFAAGTSASASTDFVFPFPDQAFWSFLTLDVLLVMIILYLTGIIKGVSTEFVALRKFKLFPNWNKKLVDAIPIENEGSILFDHEYDGIRELDNNLPPWWKYGFYLTIIWAVGYLFYFQILEVGNLQEAEYLAEMEEGDRSEAEYKAAHPELITAENVVMITDPSILAEGKTVYTTYCMTCHMEGGKGGIGPNLTDKEWIYDGDIKGVFKTVSDGAQNGMVAWKELLPANEIQAVSSYLLQLEYVAPPIGKAPQGELIFE